MMASKNEILKSTHLKRISHAAFMIFALVACSTTNQKEKESLTFLHTAGQDIVNESGEKVFLQGVGLGNWLLPEGYMWKFGENGDRPRKIEKVIVNLIGEKKAASFWTAFRKNYITETDIERIAQLGFNSVRPAMNSRLFLAESEETQFLDEGFQLMDSLISWCRKHKLYVILDMHGAPGGQTGANIDDSANDKPELFENPRYQDQLVALWIKLATRYKDEPVVAAYDLLNEPLPIGTGAADTYKHLLVPLYKRITAEIRKVDTRHMITLEGFNWSNDWSVFDKPFDDNVFYQFHYYCWNKPDNLNNIDYYLKKRQEFNVPVWVGETGEKGNTIYWATAQYFAANNIGSSFWPWKKMDTENTPYSIKKPAGWDLLVNYTRGEVKPDSLVAEKALNELLENCKLNNCVYFSDVVNAYFNRVPARIEAENYGHEGLSQSYFVADTAQRAETYRVAEPVSIKLLSNDSTSRSSEQYVALKQSEWVTYQFNSRENRKYELTIYVSTTKTPATLSIQVNDEWKDIQIESTEWKTVTIGGFELREGVNKIHCEAKSNDVKLDWLNLQ
jgi:hypothetical protein